MGWKPVFNYDKGEKMLHADQFTTNSVTIEYDEVQSCCKLLQAYKLQAYKPFKYQYRNPGFVVVFNL